MSSRNLLYTNPEPCKHLANYKLKYGSYGFNSLQHYLETTPKGRTSVQYHEQEIPRCTSCRKYQDRLYTCLICSSIFCSRDTLSHAQSENGHDIAVDMARSELFCCLCRDQVYDPDFDRTVVLKHIKNLPRNRNRGVEGVAGRSSKRRKLNLGVESDSEKEKSVSTRDRKEKKCSPLGLRGLNNLGSTCYMNCVLQALFRAPPLRDYFLNDHHNRGSCRNSAPDNLCLLCNIGVICSAVFSGDRSPYSPAQFLFSWWQHQANLARYAQQDAHEFFISLLDKIHEKEGKARNPTKDHEDCQCIAHKLFSGLLRSDVTCLNCGNISTTYEPCIDFSLDLDMSNCSLTDVAIDSTKSGMAGEMSTLFGCLKLFTKPEKFGSDEKLHCQICQERQDSLKQMSIKRLPTVLCLHIKRIEQDFVKRVFKKINRYLQFPFYLDMSPHLSSSVVRERFGNRIFNFEGDDSDTPTEFEIFAVITHAGLLESGHYVTYLRLENHWYKCDDAWIYEVDEDTVRTSQCYMLFYVQKMVYYKDLEDFKYFPGSSPKDSLLSVADGPGGD